MSGGQLNVATDGASIALAQLFVEELGRAIESILDAIEPAVVKYDLTQDDDGICVDAAEVVQFNENRSRLNAKAVEHSVYQWRKERYTGHVLVWPKSVLPLLKCYERAKVVALAHQGNTSAGRVEVILPTTSHERQILAQYLEKEGDGGRGDQASDGG